MVENVTEFKFLRKVSPSDFLDARQFCQKREKMTKDD